MVKPADDLLERFRALCDEARTLDDPALLAAVRRMLDAPARADVPEDVESWHGMIGRSPAIVGLRSKIEKFAAVSSPVLIHGESGTGKDLVARILHELSPRRGRAMVCENCAAIPETLLESVLFGHVKGAFTGAVRNHPGHFVSAHRGTLFLDEVGEMPLSMQAKLLRVLQEGEVRAVGSEKIRMVDVRVIAATNSNLEAMVRERRFREDLFFRLNVLQLELPPLRAREDDVVLLAQSLLGNAASEAGRELRFAPDAVEALREFAWPGNVRQLQNEVQRLVALADGPEIRRSDLSEAIRG